MKIGYVRVSTQEQKTLRQEVLMQQLGVEKVFIEKVSGKNRSNRPMLQEAISYVREGDTFVVSEISRLARNTRDLLEIIETIEANGVQFISMKENIDTSTPTGKFMLTIFGAQAQLERAYILSRQAEGIAIAKSQGKYLGRSRIKFDQNKFLQLYPKWKNQEMKAKDMMRQLGLQPATFYRRVKEYELLSEEIDIFGQTEEKSK